MYRSALDKSLLHYHNKAMPTPKTASGLTLHAKEFLNLPTIYFWGGLGQLLSAEVFQAAVKKYPAYYTPEKRRQLLPFVDHGYYALDCSGLIKNYLMGGKRSFCYNSSLDYNSHRFIQEAPVKGPLESLPEIPGICLYLEGHVGIYIGQGLVIEATENPQFGNGVVLTRLEQRLWQHWFYCPQIKYED